MRSGVMVSIGAIQILIMVIALVRAKTLSVLLGPADFGVVSTIDQTVLTAMQLAHLSLPFVALKFMSRRHSDGHGPFEQTYATFFRALGLLSIVAVAAVSIALTLAPNMFGSDMVPYRPYIYLAMLGLPSAMLTVFFVNTLAAAERGASSAMLNMLGLLTAMIAAIGGAVAGGLTGLYVASVIVASITTLATIVYLRRTLGVHVLAKSGGLRAEFRANPEILSYALFIYAAMTAYSFTMLATRYFVFGAMGATAAGLLQALIGIALTAGAVITPMNGLFLTPYLNRQVPQDDKARATNDFASKVLALFLAGGVVIALFPATVITLLFSSKFAPAAAALYLYVIWQCLHQFGNAYLQLLIGLDDVAFFSVANCVVYGAVALLFPILIRQLGLGGVGLALSLGSATLLIAAAVRLQVKFGIIVRGLVWGRALFCLAAIWGATFISAAGPELSGRGLIARAGYAALVIVVMSLTLDPSERDLVRAATNLVRRRATASGRR